MDTTAADHRSRFTFSDSEQSLRRSFSAIHHRGKASGFECNRQSPVNNAIVPAFFSEGLPPLPFSRYEQLQVERSSQERPAKKLQRRHSPVVDHRLTNEKQRERRQLAKAGLNENSDRPRRRRTSVTFSGLPPSLSSAENKNRRHESYHGFRSDYSLGETIRTPSHMTIEPTSEQAIRAVTLLKTHDFAFVKRSDGSYSFAILAYRSTRPLKGAKDTSDTEECMNFVMSDNGATKTVRERHWSEFVRLVSMEESSGRPAIAATPTVHSIPKSCATPVVLDSHVKEHSCEVVVHQEIQLGSAVDRDLPSMITFVLQMNDECSVISSVSDRAMGLRRPQSI